MVYRTNKRQTPRFFPQKANAHENAPAILRFRRLESWAFQAVQGDKTLASIQRSAAKKSTILAQKLNRHSKTNGSSTTITRTHIISALNARGIATAIHYPTPLHLQEVA